MSARLETLDAADQTHVDDSAATLAAAEQTQVLQQISVTIAQQSAAIAAIAEGLATLQHSLPDTIASAVQASAAPAAGGSLLNNFNDGNEHSEASGENVLTSEPETDPLQQLRNAFMDDFRPTSGVSEQPEPEPEAAEPEPSPLNDVLPSEETADAELENLLNELSELEEVASIPEESLRDAVMERDRFISSLTRRLQRRLRTRQPLTGEQLRELRESLPEDLQRRVEETLQSLDAQIRLGELELSLERARMGRQLASMQGTRRKLEATARSLGLTIKDDGTLDGEPRDVPQGSKGRRWLGVLGFGV
ncbi:MAG: hypothetical protein RIK87_12065 [Fuerstiella sp.]